MPLRAASIVTRRLIPSKAKPGKLNMTFFKDRLSLSLGANNGWTHNSRNINYIVFKIVLYRRYIKILLSTITLYINLKIFYLLTLNETNPKQ